MSSVTVALFGGSFNPPHVGHVLAVAYTLSVGLVDRVLVVPVFEHALGKRLAPFPHRLEMSERAFGWLPGVEVSRVEERLGAPSRTLRTIQALEVEHPEWRLRLLVGSDITGELEKWHAFEEIARRAPPLILPRAGSSEAGAQPALLPEVSSTRVRQLLERAATPSRGQAASAEGERSDAQLAALVPKAVLDYIAEHALYAGG
jgi:nicotinate-nucleotide adenylyltransferase